MTTSLSKIKNDSRSFLLLVFALFCPFIGGYQYLEWSFNSSTHQTWMFAFSFGVIEYSDWGGIFLKTPYISISSLPYLIPWLLYILIRIVFALSIVLTDDRRGKIFAVLLGILLICCFPFLWVQLMTINSIWGIPPGLLFNISQPDTDYRFVFPLPILLLLAIIMYMKKFQKQNSNPNMVMDKMAD